MGFGAILVNLPASGAITQGDTVALAYILNSKLVEGENIFKTIYFMPMVTSSVAISIIFQNLFGNNYGIINWFLSLFGQKAINWLGFRANSLFLHS